MSEFGNNAVCLVIKDIPSVHKGACATPQPHSFEQLVKQFGHPLTKASDQLKTLFAYLVEPDATNEEISEQINAATNRYQGHNPIWAEIPAEKVAPFTDALKSLGGMALFYKHP